MVDDACVATNGTAMDNMTIRPITAADDERMGAVARENLKVAINLYEKLGYRRIEPINPSHATMDHFCIKEL